MTTEAHKPMSFEFTCDGPAWKGVPVVNGHQLLGVKSADVHLDARSFPEVTLTLDAGDLLKLGLGNAVIKLDEGTREALVSLGWTPPGDAAVTEPAPRRNEITEA